MKPVFWLLLILAGLGLGETIWGVFVVTPMEQALFYSQKIFYYHVACAFMLFLAVAIAGGGSVWFLATRNARADRLALAAAEVAILFGAIVLISGSIWAKAAWSVWWKWEPRLTMSLLLWLVVVGAVLVRAFAGVGAERLTAGVLTMAVVVVPLIYYGVREGDNHPQAKVVQTLDLSMKATFWFSVLTFFLLLVLLIWQRVATLAAEARVVALADELEDRGVA